MVKLSDYYCFYKYNGDSCLADISVVIELG